LATLTNHFAKKYLTPIIYFIVEKRRNLRGGSLLRLLVGKRNTGGKVVLGRGEMNLLDLKCTIITSLQGRLVVRITFFIGRCPMFCDAALFRF